MPSHGARCRQATGTAARIVLRSPDQPDVLARYVRAFHEDFLGLYGDRKETARTAAEFKVEAGEHHSTPVFLLDPNGRLRLVVRAETSAESIAEDIRLLLKASKPA